MSLYISWLPAMAIERGVATLPFASVIKDWSSTWFADGQVVLVAQESGAPLLFDVASGDAWEIPKGLALMSVPNMQMALAGLLYGTPDEEALTREDRLVLEACGETCLTDLRNRLTAALRLPGDAAWRPRTEPAAIAASARAWQVETMAGRCIARLVATEALIVDWVKSRLPPTTSRAPLASLPAALSSQKVTVSARVGGCRLATRDLGDLEIGDVVLLDKTVNDDALLAVDLRATRSACRVGEADGRLHLTLV
jgi:hypothetical protein